MKWSRCQWIALGLLLSASMLTAQTSPAIEPSPATQPAPALAVNPVLDRADQLLKAQQAENRPDHYFKEIHDLLVPWLKTNIRALDRDRGLYLLAELYFEKPDRVRAFYHCDELMDNYPESRFFFPALQMQYQIAEAYLDGYKEKFLGLPLMSMEDEAIEMMFRIQERSPGSPLAEKALRHTADHYFNQSDFDLAGDAYGSFIRLYPRSADIPQVRLRQAFSSLAQFRGWRFDATPLLDAREEFRQIQQRYPDLAAEANVAGWIERIDKDLARKAYNTGDFYQRTSQPRGAAYMFRYVAQTYPNTMEADLARKALAKMPASALVDPPPPQSNPDAAATQPVVPADSLRGGR